MEKDKDTLALIKYIADEDKLEKILEKSVRDQDAGCKKRETVHTGVSAGGVEGMEVISGR